MVRKLFICLVFVCISGCTGPTFTNLGNGVAVPTESVDRYAKAKGVSRIEAKEQMLAEWTEKQQSESEQ